MNTIGSVYYGWAFLILCGGGSYYFAKRSINADRYERQAAENERRMRQSRLPHAAQHLPHTMSEGLAEKASARTPKKTADREADGGAEADASFNPSLEVSADPAPTDHAPGSTMPHEESKFESSRPFKSRKGDRFS